MKKNKILIAGLSSSLLLAGATLLENNFAFADEKSTTQAVEDKKVSQNTDYKNLSDGVYTVDVVVKNAGNKEKLSMANAAVEKPAKLLVKDGEYKAHIKFNPLVFSGMKGYLGDISSYENNQKVQGKVLEWYSPEEKDGAFDVYKEAYPDRTAYPKVVEVSLHKNNIDSNGKLEEKVNVYVPVMASISQAIGHQDALPVFDFTKLKTVLLDKKPEPKKPETPKQNEDKLLRDYAKSLANLTKSEEISNLYSEKSVDAIKKLAPTLEGETVSINDLKKAINTFNEKKTELSLNNGEFNLDYSIKSASGKKSMADGLFVKNAKVVKTSDNYYAEIPLQSVTMGKVIAHLTSLDVYKDKKTEEKYTVKSLGKHIEKNEKGVATIYDNKLLVELGSELKDTYPIKMGLEYFGTTKFYDGYLALNNKDFETNSVPKNNPTKQESPLAKVNVNAKVTFEQINFETKEVPNAELLKGERVVKTKGELGERKITTTVDSVGDVVLKTNNYTEITKNPVNEIIEFGTKEKEQVITKEDKQEILQPKEETKQAEKTPEVSTTEQVGNKEKPKEDKKEISQPKEETKQAEKTTEASTTEQVGSKEELKEDKKEISQTTEETKKEKVVLAENVGSKVTKEKTKVLAKTGEQTTNTISLGMLLLGGILLAKLRRKNK